MKSWSKLNVGGTAQNLRVGTFYRSTGSSAGTLKLTQRNSYQSDSSGNPIEPAAQTPISVNLSNYSVFYFSGDEYDTVSFSPFDNPLAPNGAVLETLALTPTINATIVVEEIPPEMVRSNVLAPRSWKGTITYSQTLAAAVSQTDQWVVQPGFRVRVVAVNVLMIQTTTNASRLAVQMARAASNVYGISDTGSQTVAATYNAQSESGWAAGSSGSNTRILGRGLSLSNGDALNIIINNQSGDTVQVIIEWEAE